MDLEIMARLNQTDPDLMTTEVFLELFMFFWEYISRVMYLPGQVVQWNNIANMGNLSLKAIPRNLVIGFGLFCQDHC